MTFTCDDGGTQGSGIASCVADGTNPPSNSKTISGNGTVTGTATDVAGNAKTLSVEVKNVDTTPPTLSGATSDPTHDSTNGWYTSDVTVKWIATDESGIPTPPADTKITGEGTSLTGTTSVKNGAGLETTATSSPAVKIDGQRRRRHQRHVERLGQRHRQRRPVGVRQPVQRRGDEVHGERWSGADGLSVLAVRRGHPRGDLLERRRRRKRRGGQERHHQDRPDRTGDRALLHAAQLQERRVDQLGRDRHVRLHRSGRLRRRRLHLARHEVGRAATP